MTMDKELRMTKREDNKSIFKCARIETFWFRQIIEGFVCLNCINLKWKGPIVRKKQENES